MFSSPQHKQNKHSHELNIVYSNCKKKKWGKEGLHKERDLLRFKLTKVTIHKDVFIKYPPSNASYANDTALEKCWKNGEMTDEFNEKKFFLQLNKLIRTRNHVETWKTLKAFVLHNKFLFHAKSP